MLNKLALFILLLCAAPASFADSTDVVKFKAAFPAADTVAQHELRTPQALRKKYRDEAFNYERDKPDDTKKESTFYRFLKWLGKQWDKIFGSSSNKKQNPLNIQQIVIRVLAIGIILFVVYMLVRAILNKEGMWLFGRSKRRINGYDVTENDIKQMDFPALINATREAGDYRAAVRYHYLWLLREMADREMIQWHTDKTNSDYLRELKDEALKREFEFLSYIYDYSWYGEFELDQTGYERAEAAFRKTINLL